MSTLDYAVGCVAFLFQISNTIFSVKGNQSENLLISLVETGFKPTPTKRKWYKLWQIHEQGSSLVSRFLQVVDTNGGPGGSFLLSGRNHQQLLVIRSTKGWGAGAL
jgi:hypothetical protein